MGRPTYFAAIREAPRFHKARANCVLRFPVVRLHGLVALPVDTTVVAGFAP